MEQRIAEKILLSHPDMVIYYRMKYKIYELLKLDFDLFFTEDIINYKNDFYMLGRNVHKMDIKYKSILRKYPFNIIKHPSIVEDMGVIVPDVTYNGLFMISLNMIFGRFFYINSVLESLASLSNFSTEQLKIVHEFVSHYPVSNTLRNVSPNEAFGIFNIMLDNYNNSKKIKT